MSFFARLAPIARHTDLQMMLASAGGGKFILSIIPRPKGVEEKELRQPVQLIGTPEELDAQLADALMEYGSAVGELRSSIGAATAAIKASAAKPRKGKAEKKAKKARPSRPKRVKKAARPARAPAPRKAARPVAPKAVRRRPAKSPAAAPAATPSKPAFGFEGT